MLNISIALRIAVCVIAVLYGLFSPLHSSVSLGKTTEDKTEIVQMVSQKAPESTKPAIVEVGFAKYYGGLKGKKLELTAAHKWLKKGTIVRVESLEGDQYETILVEITDRLPDIPVNAGTVIDLSKKAAIAMNPSLIRKGKLKVRITVIE